jgi:hypothetical protein
MNLTSCPRCCEATFDLHLTRSGFCNACHVGYLGGKVNDFYAWDMLTVAQRDKWRDLLADDERVLDHSADRRPIRPGATFWDYDLRPTTVLAVGSLDNDHRSPMGAVIWWRTTTGLFDGSRLAHVHPSTRMTVAEAALQGKVTA